MRSSSAAALGLFAALLVQGCLFDQRREMREARDAYEACVAEHPDDAGRACATERAEMDTRSERYQDDAQRAWGCTGSTDACDPRDRAPAIP